MFTVGAILYQNIKIIKIVNEIKKSISVEKIGVSGITRRGKYTLVKIALPSIKLFVDFVMVLVCRSKT